MTNHRRPKWAPRPLPLWHLVTGTSRRDTYGEPYLLSQDEVSHRLSISRTTLWRLMKEGEFEAVRIGSRVFILSSSVEAFLQRHSSGRSK